MKTPPIVDAGALGLPPERHYGPGVWPHGVADTPLNRWAVARCGYVHGWTDEVVWFERAVAPDGRDTIVPVVAYGHWRHGSGCSSTVGECTERGCPTAGRCQK